jgi:alkylation response protein AidB-like acyl-CoA dehydrogenase
LQAVVSSRPVAELDDKEGIQVFEPTKEQEQFRAEVRQFAEDTVKPKADQVDREAVYPSDLLAEAGRRGYMGANIPAEYGGHKIDGVSYAILIEEVSRVCASTGVILAVHNSLGNLPICLFGTEMQKKQYLPRLSSGEWIGGFMLTEEQAGSDAGALQTSAKLDGEEYVVNGAKRYILSGTHANTFILMAITDPSQGKKGISALIMERDLPGVEVVEKYDMMGVRGCGLARLSLTDVRIPKTNLLGEEGDGFKIALGSLDHGRIGIAAQSVGIAQAALEHTVAYAKERQQFGKPIASFQAIQWMIADAATQLDAARLLTYRAAALKDSGARFGKEAAMAKLYASECAVTVTGIAAQVHGGSGYMKDRPIERFYRDARILTVYEGTSEVQRMVIAAAALR